MQSSGSREQRDLDTLHRAHDEAFLYIAQGLSCEECGQTALAADTYRKGLERLDEALLVPCGGRSGPQWDKARKMRQKMLRVKSEVEGRLRAADGEESEDARDDPPSYEEAVGVISSVDVTLASGATAEVLMYIPRGVQVFHVSPSGEVSAPSSPTELTVYRLKDEPNRAIQRNLAWIHAGTWIYPLLAGKAPALRSGYGAYLFPDIDSGEEGAAVGILLPSDVSTEMQILFESLMEQLTAIRIQPLVFPGRPSAWIEPGLVPEPRAVSAGAIPEAEVPFSKKVADGIIAGTSKIERYVEGQFARYISVGSQVLSAGISKSAEVTGQALISGVQKLKEYIRPEEKPIFVDPRVKQGIHVLREITGSIRGVSGYVVNKVGDLSMALGQLIAKNVSCDLQCDGVDGANSSKVNDVMIIATGGLKGFSTLYMGLEQAARTLAGALAAGSVQIVDHKYGKDAAEVVSDAVCSVGNVALTANNVRSLGVKSIAKKTVRETGKAVLLEYVSNPEEGVTSAPENGPRPTAESRLLSNTAVKPPSKSINR